MNETQRLLTTDVRHPRAAHEKSLVQTGIAGSTVQLPGTPVLCDLSSCPPGTQGPGGERCHVDEHSSSPHLHGPDAEVTQDGPDQAMVMTPAAGDGISTEAINSTLKHHALQAADWDYQATAALLHEWARRFNQAFNLQLDTPALQFASIGRRTLGTYMPGRNGLGLHHELTLNTRYLERPLAQTLEVLLHEQLHEWQELHGKPSKPNYHNREYRVKARSLGLVVDNWGHSLGVESGPFTQLLERHGVDVTVFSQGEVLPQILAGTSKLKKWTCGCTNVRAAVQLHAQCLKCGRGFELVDSVSG